MRHFESFSVAGKNSVCNMHSVERKGSPLDRKKRVSSMGSWELCSPRLARSGPDRISPHPPAPVGRALLWSPLCRRRRREQREHHGLPWAEGEDTHFVRLVSLESGLDESLSPPVQAL